MTAEHSPPIAMLLSEHAVIQETLDGALEDLDAAIVADADPALARTALETMAGVCAYLSHDLNNHIAKEEDVFFPPLRELTNELDTLVEDMIEQHNAVRDRRASLEKVLAALDHDHDEVQAGCEAVVRQVVAAGDMPGKSDLSGIRHAVHYLEGMLLGHFDDEEENLFPPAEELLSAGVLEEMAKGMEAIDAAPPGS